MNSRETSWKDIMILCRVKFVFVDLNWYHWTFWFLFRYYQIVFILKHNSSLEKFKQSLKDPAQVASLWTNRQFGLKYLKFPDASRQTRDNENIRGCLAFKHGITRQPHSLHCPNGHIGSVDARFIALALSQPKPCSSGNSKKMERVFPNKSRFFVNRGVM